MKDERYWPVLGTWLKDTAKTPPDPRQTARRVAERLPQTRQLRRHWWLPSTRRIAGATTDIDRTMEPTPVPAANGHTPTVIGRTSSMLNPVKAVIAGALVFAIGGVFFVAGPFQQQQATVPGAATEAIAPTWVTGTLEPVDGTCERGAVTSEADVRRSSYDCTSTLTSSDPRLSGEVWEPWIEDTYQTDQGAISVGTDAYYLQNDGGGWSCWSEYVIKGATPSDPIYDNTFTCLGSGGYEGLTAVLVSTPTEGFALEFEGLIFSGDLPPVPEPPAAE